MTELKRCPFCGSKNIKVYSVEISCPQEIGSYAECLDCKSTIEVTKPHKVIDAWNTRPIEDELQARITELETELLNTVIIKYANEDEIPNMDDSVYDRMNSCSLVHGVKLFPYIEKHGKKYYLVDLENEQ